MRGQAPRPLTRAGRFDGTRASMRRAAAAARFRRQASEMLDDEQLDAVLLSSAGHEWRKVARVVGNAMLQIPSRAPGMDDRYFASRVRSLVQRGLLEANG